MDYLNGLNPEQKEAVLYTEGPLLIVAGAGAGKTRTITHRIAHLVETGVPAQRILAVTFTNKAAGEMRERIRELTRGKGMPMVATFHSLGVRILREFPKEAGVPKNFTIWDRDDSMRALKRIIEQLDDSLQPRAVLARISREKGGGVSPDEFAEAAVNFRERAVARIWREYEKTLAEEGALDFDDLLSRTLRLLRNSQDVRELLQHRWQYITIDEYQDTNRAQYEIVRLLATPRNNICAVGDLDQAIYTWRQARLENLLEFEASFPGTKVITLEQNYRSTGTIIGAANGVIEKNLNRRPKRLVATRETGEAIQLFQGVNELDEAWFIAQTAAALIEQKIRPGNIAVLYRENFQSRPLEEAMLNFGVPYRVLGTRFFDRKEVKDVLSYLRAAQNEKSRGDIVRIAAVPPRGLGKITLEKMLVGLESDLPAAARNKIANFKQTLANIKSAIDMLPASDVVRYALEESGMELMFKKMGEEGEERLGNVQELVNFATRYDFEKSPDGIEKLLEEAALQSEQDQLEDRHNAVSLMTVHASKGLEFDAVFVTGLEQGLFPSIRVDDGSRDPEEERRLFYVALTRAASKLYLTYAGQRMKYGSREFAVPSEFLSDIDPRFVELAERGQKEYEEETIR